MKSSLLYGMYNEKAQWMVLSGVLIALIVISMSVLLNEVANSSYKVSYEPLNLPYYEAKSTLFELIRAYKNGDLNKTNEQQVCKNVSKLLALNGYYASVSIKPTKNYTTPLSIVYNVSEINFTISTKNFKMVVIKNVTKINIT